MEVILSSSSGMPMYEQIKSQVRSAIYSGELGPGDKLPSLRQLAADLRVSIMTTTRAYNDLVAERLVTSEHGRAFVVGSVDPASARAAMLTRLDSAVKELVAAALSARMTRADLDILLDENWKK